jgi:hypothetical protein
MKSLKLTLFLTCTAILVRSQTQETIVAWNSWVNWSTRTADQGIASNLGISVLNTSGANTPTFSDAGDGAGQRAFADGWALGANVKDWRFQFSTLKYQNLKFSCRMMGTSPLTSFLGPRDFKLQYSTNGSSWTDVPSGTLQAGNQTYFNSLSNVSLPSACNNQATLYLRMLMTSNTSVTGLLVNAGQSHIDDISVVGVSVPEPATDISLSNSVLLVPSSGGTISSGTTVGTFSSVDFNLGNTHTYSLVSGTGSTHNSSFTVTGTTLSTAAALPAGTYNIRVRSTDNDGQSYEEAMTVNIIEPDPINSGSRKRLSNMGPDGNTSFFGNNPSIAYNSVNNEYLVVWSGDDNTSPLVDNEYEIFGQRVNASTGAMVGSRIRISYMGANGATTHRGSLPSVAYNSTDNEYMVVWEGDHNTGSLASTEFEIWGQRIAGSTGALNGSMIRISFMGTDGNISLDATQADIAWNSTNNQYLVVWRGDENAAPLVDNEFEIYGQLLSNTGTLFGSRIRISTMGTDGSTNFGALNPSVTYNATSNEFFAVWSGDDNTAPLIDNEIEIFGRRINAAGVLQGSQIRISNMGVDGNVNFAASSPDIAWNSSNNTYLVVFRGDEAVGALVDNEFELYGQLIAASGSLQGSRFRISDMGPDGNTSFGASNPRLVYHQQLNEFWVSWHGDDDAFSVDNENEIFMQRISASGAETGNNDIRVSYMGTNGSILFTAVNGALAYNSTNYKVLAVWHGDDNTAPLVDNELEIFGQMLSASSGLPVSWLSFTARKQDESVLLQWSTASEQNSWYYGIEHSTDGIRWKQVGKTDAAGNSSLVNKYQFTHQNPATGKNYYRLHQKDIDGKSGYSSIAIVNFDLAKNLTVISNPVQNGIIKFQIAREQFINLYNSSGKLLYREKLNKGIQQINVSGYAKGIYVLQSESERVQVLVQ